VRAAALAGNEAVVILARPAPAADPSCLARRDGTVPRLAQVAYEERFLLSDRLHRARLAVLADALEEAGCSDAALLDHLRGPGEHVRGCWAIDLLTGRAVNRWNS
jgi:hypothetical protein